MILYGLSTCDTCKKALKALHAAGHSVTFRDIRAEPLTAAEIAALVGEFGDRIINRNSTTWRGLNVWMKNSDPEAQLAAYPALMQRPVIWRDGSYTIGWDAAVQARYL